MGWGALYFNALASSQQGAFPFSKGTFLFSEGTSSFATPAWQTCHAGVADVPCRHGKRAVPAWQMIKCLGRMGRKGTKTSARRVETEGYKIHPTMPRACGCGGDCKSQLTHRCTKPPRRSVEWLGVECEVWGGLRGYRFCGRRGKVRRVFCIMVRATSSRGRA